MALKDHKPAFETEVEDQSTTTAETATMTETIAAPAVAQNTAVAAAKPRAKFEIAFGDVKDQFPIEAVTGLSMSAPRIKGEQGQCYIGDKPLGDKIRITLESWNIRQLISCGLDSKDAGYQESMEYLANSYDGATIEGRGMAIDEYISYLKSLGYDKARAAKYGDLWCFVTWTAKEGDIPQEAQTLHLLQASQTSLGNFTAFCTTQGLLKSKGIVTDLSQIQVNAVARSKGSNKYTNFDFVLPSK